MVPKFRAYWEYTHEMAEVIEINYKGNWVCDEPYVVANGRCDLIPLSECNLMQSTGLKDKNGVEIFEGDVLLHTSSSVNYSDTYWHSYVQAYRIDNGAFRIKGKHIYDTDLMSARRRIEVVGNIYQHQNLLEKEYFSTSDGVVVQADEN